MRVSAGLAPLADLARAHDLALGGNPVAGFLGGTPAEHDARYRAASPRKLLPLGVKQLILRGTADTAVPIGLSRAYVRHVKVAGDEIEFVELEAGGHMDFLDPANAAHAHLYRWLADWAFPVHTCGAESRTPS